MALIDLDPLLARPGLLAQERLLVAAKVAIGPADWPRLGACVCAARSRAVARSALEEVLLQGCLFFGFPRTVSAFEVLAAAWPIAEAPSGGGLPAHEQPAAGRALFAGIYGDNASSVLALLRGFHGELHDFVLDAAYGRILTRPGLTPRQRELLAVGALQVLGQTPQLVAHARGAIAFGATELEVREAIFTAALDEGAAEAMLRRVVRSRG